jgi:hypothetical protein
VKRELSGVLTKTGQGFILYNHKGEVNLTEVLKTFWQLDTPVHIKIESDVRTLLDERHCDIYLARDEKKQYKYHINGINIENVLEHALFNLIYVLVETEREDRMDGSIHKS